MILDLSLRSLKFNQCEVMEGGVVGVSKGAPEKWVVERNCIYYLLTLFVFGNFLVMYLGAFIQKWVVVMAK